MNKTQCDHNTIAYYVHKHHIFKQNSETALPSIGMTDKYHIDTTGPMCYCPAELGSQNKQIEASFGVTSCVEITHLRFKAGHCFV